MTCHTRAFRQAGTFEVRRFTMSLDQYTHRQYLDLGPSFKGIGWLDDQGERLELRADGICRDCRGQLWLPTGADSSANE